MASVVVLNQAFEADIPGVCFWSSKNLGDSRGTFDKFFSVEDFPPTFNFQLAESFITISNPGVVRGMHLQIGKSASARIIRVLSGEIYDVLIDLRQDNPSRTIQTRKLSSSQGDTLFVPPGVAHGFQAFSQAKILYMSDNRHVPHLDSGVNPLSIGINWPLEISEISSRDMQLPHLDEFKNAI